MRTTGLLLAALAAAACPSRALEPVSDVRVEVSSAGVSGLVCGRRPFQMEWTKGVGQRYRKISRETFSLNPDPRYLALGLFGMVLMAPAAVLAVPGDLAAAPLRRECGFELQIRGRLTGWAGGTVGGERLVLEGRGLLEPGIEEFSEPRYLVTRATGTADAEGRFALSLPGRVGRSSELELRWLVEGRASNTMTLGKHGRRFRLSEPEPEFGVAGQTMEPLEIRPSPPTPGPGRTGSPG